MAPPKTMAISQQQHQTTLNTVGQQAGDMKQNTVKPRKRKGKQQQNQPIEQQQQRADHVQKSAIEQPPVNISNKNKQNVESTPLKAGISDQTTKKQQTITNNLATNNPVIVPIERTTLSNKSQNKQTKESAAPAKKQAELTIGKKVDRVVQPTATTTTETPVITKHKQLVPEEADDIDAGIELDGSSNSGSSVKDIGEDQKSASVSPVMAQATGSIAQEGFNSNGSSSVNKQTAEVTPIDKMDGAVCTAAKLLTSTTTTTTDEPLKVKKSLSLATKQQLAANQQVIDADEQQLQQRLQNKQKKLVSQDSGASLDDSSLLLENDNNGLKKAQTTTDVIDQVTNDKTAGVRPRRFSSQTSQESADASSCKVCGQHVYQMEKMLAEKSIYHKRCFRCYQCKIQLRVDNYSSHEGQVYCKAHHRQIFQPQVKLDDSNDVDIVAKSTTKPVDDYLLHRGRLSELSFSFLQPKPQELFKRQMIICENEPAELPKDVVRSDTKLDDGIDHLNLNSNLNNILEKFERGTANGDESQPSSAGMVFDKPSFNIRKTLAAFESKTNETDERNERSTEKPVVKKLNLNGFLNRQNSEESEVSTPTRPLPVKRSGSLMLRLKKYESRIAGEHVDDDDKDSDDENNNAGEPKSNKLSSNEEQSRTRVSTKLSSLKNQWENGEISKKRNDGEAHDENYRSPTGDKTELGPVSGEKSEELIRIRHQLARKKSGDASSVKNIYENAIKEAQLQQQASRRESTDLSALNGFSTVDIQQKLLQRTEDNSSQKSTTPNKDHFQLNLSNRANKLKERFELGLINNSSRDDSDQSDSDEVPISKLEQIRQEKLEDLSIFTEGEIKAREARNMFQQIDRRISAANGGGRQPIVNSRSLASVQDAMRSKLTNRMAAKTNDAQNNLQQNNHHPQQTPQDTLENRPIRLTNNVRI